MKDTLNDLGLNHKTDKASNLHDYLVHYEQFLSPFRLEAFDMLEIGVLNGASIRMWHDYFPAARIVGVDLKAIELDGDLPRYTFERGSQGDPRFLFDLAKRYSFKFIVEDGSHLWGHQIFTFQTLFPHLENDGIYICEDIQTSFGNLAERYCKGAPESAASYFLRIAQFLAAGRAGKTSEAEDPLMHFLVNKVRSMTFIRECVIIKS